MEDRVKEYTRHYKKETQLLKEETTKRKKHLTYNEIKKIIESGSEIKSNENKSIALRTNAQQEHQEEKGQTYI